MDDFEQKNVGSFNDFYRKFFNPGVHCLRAWKASDCTIHQGVLWTFVILSLTTLLLLSKRRFVTSSGKNHLPTPPGSRGWPWLGESYSFYHAEDTAQFVFRRVKKYGEVFFSNIIGGPHVMVHTPDFVRFTLIDPRQILMNEIPAFAKKLFRPGHIMNAHGKAHTENYSIALKSVSTKYHEPWMLGFSDVIRRTVDSWKGRTVNCYLDSQKMFIDAGFVYIFGRVNYDMELQKRLGQDIREITSGLVSVPINIPGTRYARAIQARKNLDQFLLQQVQQHLKLREEGVKPDYYSNMEFFLDHREQSGKEVSLNDPECIKTVLELVNISLHGQFEAIPHLFAWVMKFLSENPEVLQQVKAEQDAIRSSKDGPDYNITSEDMAKMTFTSQVLQETLRLSSIVGSLLRKVKTDFEYKGFIIPKGWTLHLGIRAMHYNPDFFPDPYKFDPLRFQDPGKIKPDTYLPFGFGNRTCLGKGILKMQILVAIHYVSTRLRWTALDPAATITYNPQARITGGYPVEVHAD